MLKMLPVNIGTILYNPKKNRYWLCAYFASSSINEKVIYSYSGSTREPAGSEAIDNFVVCRKIDGEVKAIHFKIVEKNISKISCSNELIILEQLNDLEMVEFLDTIEKVKSYQSYLISNENYGSVYEVDAEDNSVFEFFIPMRHILSFSERCGYNGFITRYDGTMFTTFKSDEEIKEMKLVGKIPISVFIKYKRFYNNNNLFPLFDKELIIKSEEE